MSRMQNTIQSPCRISGRGYWSGQVNTLTFLPAAADTGIRFVRVDLSSRPVIPAVAESRQGMPLRTRLAANGAEVDMVEHVMAALFALQIDNVEIHCTCAEMPGLDGSSQPVALALEAAGIRPLDSRREVLQVSEPLCVEGKPGQFLRVEPADAPGLTVEYHLDYGPDSIIGQSVYRTQVTPTIFLNELAPARTFITRQEADSLQAQGLARHVTERDLLVFAAHGPENNTLRYPDECARHKALDLIGDLALCGVDLHARVTARCTGHQLNGLMADKLRSLWRDSAPRTAGRVAA
ncbi:MAG: UDP-3-O-acyl-N-acetylglucosamine deacetylase [Pirellulaceae bacterium]|nr:MAG: UDP-3-O-acyl-N-acetylglucosamine deacetylase [Pirellulaceae bacterium]